MNRLNQIGALLLLSLLFVKVLIVPAIYLDFEFRKEYIKKYLCVNRLNPSLHCDGKCYLAKRLIAAEEKQQHQKSVELNELIFGTEFVPSLQQFIFENITIELDNLPSFTYLKFFPKGIALSLFHPPTFSC